MSRFVAPGHCYTSRGAVRSRRRTPDHPSASVIVEGIERLNNALDRGDYFYVDIQKEGVLLFDSGRHALAEPGPVDPAEA